MHKEIIYALCLIGCTWYTIGVVSFILWAKIMYTQRLHVPILGLILVSFIAGVFGPLNLILCPIWMDSDNINTGD